MNINDVAKALKKNRYEVSVFENKEMATEYLTTIFNNEIIGFGDSETMVQMELKKKLSVNNTVFDPKDGKNNDEFLKIAKKCLTTDIFMTSVNGLTEDGVIVNIDGTGNRVAGSLFGHKKVYYIVGKNKIASDIEAAIWRARNIASPKNSARLGLRTPCAVKCDKCYNCSSPDRICNALLIEFKKMDDIDMEVVLINEDLGF